MSGYNHENNFFVFGLGIVAAAGIGLLIGTTTLVDFAAALFAAYVILRIVNVMSRAENKKRR